jgi:hypothetical protein
MKPKVDPLLEELKRKYVPNYGVPKLPKAEVVVHPAAEELTAQDRYQRLCEHNRALVRQLRDECDRSIAAECTKQQLIDQAWEASRQTQVELDALYAWTCNRGPGDSDWGLR